MQRIALLVALAFAAPACFHPIQDAHHGQLSNEDVARTALLVGVVVGGVALFALAGKGDHPDDMSIRPLSDSSLPPFQR